MIKRDWVRRKKLNDYGWQAVKDSVDLYNIKNNNKFKREKFDGIKTIRKIRYNFIKLPSIND